MHSEEDHRVLDRNAVAAFIGHDATSAREIYAGLLASLAIDAEVLCAALHAGDAAGAAHSAHRIKGACRMYGASLLADAAARIESAGHAGDAAAARAGLDEFEREYTRLRPRLAALAAV